MLYTERFEPSGAVKKFFSSRDPVVPVHHPRLLLETAVSLGADRTALLESMGITATALENPDTRLSYDQFGALERTALALTSDPSLSVRWGRATRLVNSGLAGIAALTSENLEAAFRVLKQYYLQVLPAWDLDLRVEESRAFLTLRETIPRGDLRTFATEAVLAGLQGLVNDALGRAFTVKRVRLSYPAPPHRDLYAVHFPNIEFVFDEPVTEVEFDRAILTERIVTADPVTRTAAEQAIATEATRTTRVDGVTAQVRKVLLDNGARRMTLREVARALQTSSRSLRRALSETGSSYQRIAGDVLRARAEERMRAGDAKIELIARELGFTDARSFRRAFKRWTGQNPNEFRRS